MTNEAKLRIIKSVHTLIWVLFNLVIAYMLYAVIAGRLDIRLWIGFGLVALEGLVLLCFRFSCPLTILARRYSDSDRDNFDIYLPAWLARYTKIIYSALVAVIILLLFIRLSTVKNPSPAYDYAGNGVYIWPPVLTAVRF